MMKLINRACLFCEHISSAQAQSESSGIKQLKRRTFQRLSECLPLDAEAPRLDTTRLDWSMYTYATHLHDGLAFTRIPTV